MPVLLVALAALGLWLVLTGGSDSSNGGSDDAASSVAGSGSTKRLQIKQTDTASVAALGGLDLPDSTDDFKSARLDDDSQLDVTFTITADDEKDFIKGSGLPQPSEGQRVITHASPLWDLDVKGEISGSANTKSGVTRALELTQEDGRTRVRLVLTPAS